MIRLPQIALALLLLIPVSASSSATVTWRTLARAPLLGDTVIVRGAVLLRDPRQEALDSTFTAYRLEHADGRLWFADSLPRDWWIDGGDCELACDVVPRDSGFVARLSCGCWPDYPVAHFTPRYVVASPGSVVCSDWLDVDWNPQEGDAARFETVRQCVCYELPVVARIERDTLIFVLRDVWRREGARERIVPAHLDWDCWRDGSFPVDTLQVLRSAGSRTASSIRLSSAPDGRNEVEVISARAIVMGTTPADLEVTARRIEVKVRGETWFIAPDALENAGFGAW